MLICREAIQDLPPTRSPHPMAEGARLPSCQNALNPRWGDWVGRAPRQQLKLLGSIWQEALNLLFAKHGKPQIA
jgi:hypothetical protein